MITAQEGRPASADLNGWTVGGCGGGRGTHKCSNGSAIRSIKGGSVMPRRCY